MQSRELSWMGRRFGELRLGNVRRPSARGSTRGPGSPRIAPGRNRGLPARGTVSTPKSFNTDPQRGRDAGDGCRSTSAAGGEAARALPRRAGMEITGRHGHRALHIQAKLWQNQASSQQSSLIKDKPT